MAQSSHPLAPTRVVLISVISLVALQLLVQIADRFLVSGLLMESAVLRVDAAMQGQVWRLFTYGLVHSPLDPGHLIWNCIGLYFFGLDLERRFGAARFAAFLGVAVVAGGVFVVVGNLLGISAGAALGFSAGVEACVVAWALLHWSFPVRFNMILPITGKWLLVFAAVTWTLDATGQSPYSAAAHLGGMAVGALVVLLGRRLKLRKVMSSIGLGPQLKVVRSPGKKERDHWVQ